MGNRIIAVDFDGTLCANAWPQIGKPNKAIVDYIIRQRATGAEIILWTNRSGELLDDAVRWCAEQGITFDAVNENLPRCVRRFGDSRKVYADEYLDDKSITPQEIEKRFGRIRMNLRNTL